MISKINLKMNLTISTLTGKKIMLKNIQPSDTILSLQEKIQNKEGIPINQQRLFNGGIQLNPSKSISEYEKIQDEAVIHLILRLGGPPQGPFYHQWVKHIIVNDKYLNLSPISDPYPTHHDAILHDSIPIQNKTMIEITFCSNQESIDPGKRSDNEVRVEKLSTTDPFGVSKITLGEKIWYGPSNESGCLPTKCYFLAPRTIVLVLPKLTPNMTYTIYTKHLGDRNGVPQFARNGTNTIVTNRSCFRNPDHWIFRTSNVVESETSNIESETSTVNNLCVICMENSKNIVLLPCKHMCLCSICSIEYMNQESNQGKQKCPLCKEKIKSIMKVYV